jgi:DNA-binding NtrC family response regulator
LRESWLAPLERQYLEDLLKENGGNVRAASRKAGGNAVTLYRLLKKHGLRLQREVKKANL